VIPFPDFFRPSIPSDPQWGYDQYPFDFEGIVHQIADGRQRRHCLAKSHIQQQSRNRMGLDVVDGIFLIMHVAQTSSGTASFHNVIQHPGNIFNSIQDKHTEPEFP
jgi:hypothetical protein